MTRRLLALAALLLALPSAAPAQQQNRFTLQNASSETIVEAYVSSSRVEDWGPDILGAGVLPAGQSVEVTPSFADCLLDIRVVYAGQRAENRMRVDACRTATVAFGGTGAAVTPPGAGSGAQIRPAPGQAPPGQAAPAGDPSFVFVNETGAQINEVYASSANDPNWGEDRLGASVLPPGASLPVALPESGGCQTDIRVVFADGRADERRGVDTCAANGRLAWR